MATQPDQATNIAAMPPQHLKMLYDQLEEEVEMLSMSLQSLKNTQQRYAESLESLTEINPGNVGKGMMVPLNSSVYVPGKLADGSVVVVDIGAGYFVEKSVKQAEDFFKRKMEFLKEQMSPRAALLVFLVGCCVPWLRLS